MDNLQPNNPTNSASKYHLGDTIQTKKKHPCGSDLWMIIRVGADIKIKCQGCGRIVMLDRVQFERRMKKLVAVYDASARPLSYKGE